MPIRFPDSGSVTVSPLALKDGPRSTFGVTVPPADPDNYVVRLDRPEDDRMVISIYVRSGDSAQVSVPAGTYSVRVSRGQRWVGAEKPFVRSTKTAKVLQPMTASPRLGTGIVFEPGSLITVEASASGRHDPRHGFVRNAHRRAASEVRDVVNHIETPQIAGG